MHHTHPTRGKRREIRPFASWHARRRAGILALPLDDEATNMSEPTLTRAPDSDPQPAGPAETVASGPPTGPPPGAPDAPPGYELHSLVGSGGMGAVYRAHDRALARFVAVKFLHARFAPESVTAWRFHEEARITARLDHPGIPPVHQVGHTPDGRPFLAMKLIKGDTLDVLLKKRATPTDERGRFVGVFEQIAQAVAFAHARHIIHRDLKPANVMVGGFGEVQVMDWGLAKELGSTHSTDPRASDESLSAELRAGRDGADVTQAGSLLGTPAFMPPEQAVGAIDQIDERADVFGLGAILCVILTGEPPFIADTAEAARVLAARGKLDTCFTRLDACGAEPELVALCKRCLSPEVADRPANAGEVARAVAAFRADAERRARQAETDRATAEVKVAEERKRRRVQRVLALAMIGLLVVIGYTARRIDIEQTRHSIEREMFLQTEKNQRETARKERETELRERQLTTERDVTAAVNEVQVLREQGLKQIDDPERWALTLVAARSSFKRAEGLLAAGEPTDELRIRVAAARAELDRDDRDRLLLAELDRISDDNEIRLMIPVSFTSVTSRRYATAFRTAGIDPVTAPTADAVAWLKAHRFRDRLARAVRAWSYSLPPDEQDFGINFIDLYPLDALAAVGGQAIVTTWRTRLNLGTRLGAILTAVTEDAFTREWWAAAKKHDMAAMKKLVQRPELRRMSSRELASLADALSFASEPQVLQTFMNLAYERFPGEFWVLFRYAMATEILRDSEPVEPKTIDIPAEPDPKKPPDSSKPKAPDAPEAPAVEPKPNNRANESLRYFTAAVAARPRSAIARAALGMQLIELNQEAAGLRVLKSAAEVDPTSPWPHLFLVMYSIEKEKWDDVAAPLKAAVKADPDTSYFLIHSAILALATYRPTPDMKPDESDPYLSRLIEEAAAMHPNHPGSHDLLAELHTKKGNHRAALAEYRKAHQLATSDYARKPLLAMQLRQLESIVRWEGKVQDVIDGKYTPDSSTELVEIASCAAMFENKYLLAAEVAEIGVKLDPKLYDNWTEMTKFAGWAVQAASGKGVDAELLKPEEKAKFRKMALAWLREAVKRNDNKALLPYLGTRLATRTDLQPVCDPTELAKLPPDERAEWEKFWASFPPPQYPGKPVEREVAPPPREVKP